MRDSAKAKRARDLCKKWGVILDSIGPSSIVLTVEYYSIISTAGINLPHLLSRQSSIEQTMRETVLNSKDTSNEGDDTTNNLRNLLLLSNQQAKAGGHCC